MRHNNNHKHYEDFNRELWEEFGQFFDQIGSDIKNRTWDSSEMFLLLIASSLAHIWTKTNLSIKKEICFLRAFQKKYKEFNEGNIHEFQVKISEVRGVDNISLKMFNPGFVLKLKLFRRKLRRWTGNVINARMKAHQKRKRETASTEKVDCNLYRDWTALCLS